MGGDREGGRGAGVRTTVVLRWLGRVIAGVSDDVVGDRGVCSR